MGFDNDGHKPWRPQTMTITATTMTTTDVFSEDSMAMNLAIS